MKTKRGTVGSASSLKSSLAQAREVADRPQVVPMMAVSLDVDYQKQLAPDRIARGIKRDVRILKYSR